MKNRNVNSRKLGGESCTQAHHDMPALEKSRKVSCIALIVFSGFMVATVFNIIAPIYLEKGYPYNTFLFLQSQRFGDFINTWLQVSGKVSLHDLEARGLFFNYPPFAYVITYLFTLLPLKSSLIISLAIFSLYFVFNNYKYLFESRDKVNSILSIGVLSFLSYPFLIAFDRGNFEMYVYIFLSLFIWFYIKKKDFPAVMFLSAAIAMKIFPAVFLVLFLKDRKYKETILTMGSVLLFSVFALFLFRHTDITLGHIMDGLHTYSKVYITGSAESPNYAGGLGFAHSLFGIIRLFLQSSFPAWYFPNIKGVMQIYMLFSLVFFSFIAAYIYFIEKTVWRQVALLVLSFNLLPYTSIDYKMLHLYIPLLLFADSNEETPFTKWYIILFGLLLIPKAYYIFDGLISDSGLSDISISIVISPLLLLTFTILLLYEGLKINDLPWKSPSTRNG